MTLPSLRPIQAFADRWHRGTWRTRDLADAVGAEVEWRRGGSKVLGVTAVLPGQSIIRLNARIAGTVALWPVLAHESSHVLLGHPLGFSGNKRLEWWGERDADYGSALVSIPTASAVQFVERRAAAHELADFYEVPRALVYMRGALAVVLGECDGDLAKARASLAASRRSLQSWMAAVTRTI